MPKLTDTLPTALRANAKWCRLGPTDAPAMLIHADWEHGPNVPTLLWMHGRTVQKETDPGRYLRLMRAGIAVCALDLPGHGERHDDALQRPERALDVVIAMLQEIDGIIEHLQTIDGFDTSRMAIGGMSAGGMVTLARLCQPHSFICAAVEATTGSWQQQRERAMFRGRADDDMARFNPIEHLETWREIPLLAIHSKKDEWVAYEGQRAFIEKLRARYADPKMIEFIVYESTDAPFEHAGFGRHAADAKDQQRDFLMRHLCNASTNG